MSSWAAKPSLLPLTLLVGTKSPGTALLGGWSKDKQCSIIPRTELWGHVSVGSSASSAMMTSIGDLKWHQFSMGLWGLREGAMLQPGVHRLQFVSLWRWWCMPGSPLLGSRHFIQGLGEAWGLETSGGWGDGETALGSPCPGLFTSLYSCPCSSFQPV